MKLGSCLRVAFGFFLLINFGTGYSQTQQPVPILVLADKGNFGRYSGQLLKAEGLNEFVVKPVSEIKSSYLKLFDLVILAKSNLTQQQAQDLISYVRHGGNMIVFSPDKLLSTVTGVEPTGATLSDGYIKIEDRTEIGAGIASETLQFHGDAGRYGLKGAKLIATLYSDVGTPTEFPAVVSSRYGKGHAISFLYNLPESIVYTRQGNKAWKNQERDGMVGVRHIDMFVGINNEPNWIDKERIDIPQADEQIRLLSRAVEYLSQFKKPLPRLWYFPAENKSLTVLTCDGENTGSPDFYEANINTELSLVKSKGGTMSVYLIGTGINSNTINRWRADGHEVAIHFDNTANAAKLTVENMTQVYAQSVEAFRKVYGSGANAPQLTTTRNHWITWVGWSEQAKIEMDHGFHLDLNAYKFDNHPSIKRQDWIGRPGYYTGSGIPMKFAAEDGEVLDIYQAETQIIDEQLGKKSGIFNGYKILLDRSFDDEKYAVITANIHPNGNAGIPYLDELMRICDYSNERGVPLWSAEKLLHFLQARDEATIDSINWKGSELAFQFKSTIAGESLTCMIPFRFNGLKIASLKAGNDSLEIKVKKVKGREYAFVTLQSGRKIVLIVRYDDEH